MERITSRQNPLVARFREAARGGPGTPLLLDGSHLVLTAIDSGLRIEIAAVLASALDNTTGEIAALTNRLRTAGVRTIAVGTSVLEAVSPVRSPSGVVALAARPSITPERLLTPAPPLVIAAIGVQDPGNLGAIVRTADAAGASGVVATAGSADPFGWKALRGSMGSALRVPIWADVALETLRDFVSAHHLAVIATMPAGGRSYERANLREGLTLLVGSEGHGVPEEVLAWVNETVHVPMRAGVESLNVAVTAALLLYEARRQRRT